MLCLQSAVAATINVPAGGNLQTALNSAQPGDTVILAAGATYLGHFYLPPNPGPQWITIQSSAMSSLPPSGSRISNTQASAMPKLMSPDASAALQATQGADYYHLVGLEFLTAAGVYVQDLIQVGTGGETSVAQLPHDLDFDRDYIHGDPIAGGKRGIALNGSSITVENSYISGFVSTWQDTQALAGWNGPGPFRIFNNYLEAGTENVAFGGTQPTIPGLVPSDILIQKNLLFKLLSWQPGSASYAGVPIWVKNHIELKNAQRVTIDSNTIENNWIGADQQGYVFMFTVRTLGNAVPWSVVSGINVTNNIIMHAPGGAYFSGHDSDGTGTSAGFLLQNNIWEDISSSWGGAGHLFSINDGVQGLTINHNTAFQTGVIMGFDVAPSYNVNYTNSISLNGWGVTGDGTGVGTSALNTYAPGSVFTNNILIGAAAASYPANNFFPTSVAQVGFVDFANGNYQLAPGSPYKGAASDGTDIGMNVPVVSGPLGFITIAPCRVLDTRNPSGTFGGPSITAGSTRTFPIPSGACGIPSNAVAYSANVTAVPKSKLQYLTLWPTGQPQPFVSTLNSLDGRIVANAAIVPSGTNGSISVFATDQTDVVMDINGYFAAQGSSAQQLTFVPITPCRAVDTRNAIGALGAPSLSVGSTRSFSIPSSSCNIPPSAAAYSLNATVVPNTTLQYLTLWPTGQAQPLVSTLNSRNGQVVANAAIVPAGTNGAISAFVSDQSDLILDINGYFTTTPPTPMVFTAITPCRVADTRNSAGTFGGPVLSSGSTRSFPVPASVCGIPSNASAYSLNVTAIPATALGYLTLWSAGQPEPYVSTLNSPNGQIVANAAIVPAGANGAVNVFVTDQTNVILDINGYFVP